MAIARFYAPDVTGDLVELSGQEAHHLRRVRRLGSGDEVVLFDGHGIEAQGRVERVESDLVAVRVADRTQAPPPWPALHLAAAIPKGERQDWLIEKCTELGVSSIRPLITSRSVAMPGNWAAKRARWERICLEACKQSQSAYLPEIREWAPLKDVIRSPSSGEAVWLCHPSPQAVPPLAVWQAAQPGSVVILVGPEGGFTEEEVALATGAGANLVGLGKQLLRTETAAVAVLASIRLNVGPGTPDQ